MKKICDVAKSKQVSKVLNAVNIDSKYWIGYKKYIERGCIKNYREGGYKYIGGV